MGQSFRFVSELNHAGFLLFQKSSQVCPGAAKDPIGATNLIFPFDVVQHQTSWFVIASEESSAL